jgi:hypothetical protein
MNAINRWSRVTVVAAWGIARQRGRRVEPTPSKSTSPVYDHLRELELK